MKNFFWIDLEMTGLDETQHVIVEIAVIITDINFNPLKNYHRVIYQPPEVLAKMNAWCQKTHKESGLLEKIPKGTRLEKVEEELLEFAAPYFGKKEKIVLCGNSVGNDQRFILKYMPNFSKKLHYRLIDVSSFKEVFRYKYKIKFNKKSNHRALEDIAESINELKMYLALVKPE